ncbi:hypothetical protein HID58_084853 [Brassica napus]|uniref:(rape) hypothetical protein n=1 Tax=Brassica napus TaxID=3708 RepID=A0A816IVM0_BRANA|nr:periaxin-like [Brassica napus]KAH0856592.1 hypothetical protein HID58_084853 [Brassica napus]CAF1716791.1 unnamed protein product [Brassica napus]
MGNCATKPKVLKDSEEDMVPVERDMAAPSDHNKITAEKSQSNAPNEAVDTAATARRSEKGKEILVEDDVKKEHGKSQSLSPLFHEDKVIGKEVTDITPTKPETNDKTGASSKVTKLDDASPLMATNVKAPESFDVQTRNDLEVKIPKDSEVKTPETPKAKEAEEQEVHFSENWEVKFPEELETNTTSGVVKVKEESKPPQVSKVSAPELSDVKVTKESDVPKVLEDKNVQEVSVVPTLPELSNTKVTKESDVPKVFEDKNVPENSEVHAPPELSDIKVTKESNFPKVLEDKNVLKTDEVKAAELELLKVSEVKSSEDLEIKVPKVFEVKNPGTSNVKVETKVKTDQEAYQVNTGEDTEVPEFLDAQEKIDKAEAQILEDIKVTEDKEIMMSENEEEKGLSIEKKVKESTLSGLDSK